MGFELFGPAASPPYEPFPEVALGPAPPKAHVPRLSILFNPERSSESKIVLDEPSEICSGVRENLGPITPQKADFCQLLMLPISVEGRKPIFAP